MDIGAYIATILYEHNTVAIPGLGSFVSQYKSADIDQVQGKLHPPGRTVAFNPNLVGDDGLLTRHLQQLHGIGPAEAHHIVERYVGEVKEAIERREIVVFPEVGRLYQDYEKNLQFLPDNTNFSLDAYGLPVMEAYPVARPKATKQEQKQQEMVKRDRAANKGLLAAILGGSLVIAAAVYFLFFYSGLPKDDTLQRVPTSRVNVSPSVRPAADDSLQKEDGDSLTDAAPQEEAYDTEEPDDDFDTESATTAPGQRYMVIIIGAFGNKENVTRLVDEIFEAGYEPYTEKSGPLTKVGIQKTYSNPAEIENTLMEVRNRFTSDAKVYKR